MTLEPDRERRREKYTPQEIHRRRSAKAQATDESLQARFAPSEDAWAQDPSRSDLLGIDTPTGKRHESKTAIPFWRVNHESQRIEVVYPDKPGYEERSKLKGKGFRWSPTRKAWVRKINAESVERAQSLGYTRTPDIGEPISGARKAELEMERMGKSALRHEKKAASARSEAEEYLGQAKKMADVIPFGQPIHGAADRRYREKIIAKEGKFVEKYRESKHEKGVAEHVARRAEYVKKSAAYAAKKIDTLDADIRRFDRRLDTEYNPTYGHSRQEFDEWQDNLRSRRQTAVEERAFWSEHLQSLGGVKHSKEKIKVNDRVRYRSEWYVVERVNPKSVTLGRKRLHGTFTLKYGEIQGHQEGDTTFEEESS